ncbi:DUF6197 family protein [Nonomuraea rubra]|uniref:DUF6197 family protein n=1 Tax=Nonomuraea rubra TaxID=46180 RepID=UPI0033E8DBE5
MITDTTDLTLTPAAAALAVADLIERQGLARDHYYDRDHPLPPRQAPLCLLGAIAAVCGYPPDAWAYDADARTPSWRLALDTADALIDWLALDHDEAYTESLGRWSDERDATTVAAELRDFATGVLSS